MQILLKMRPVQPLIIPNNYNYQLQSALYAMLGEVGESAFWHDNGFGVITKYKGFCFGKLEGKYVINSENRKLCFENNIYLEIRSPSFEFADAFQRAVENHPYIKLYDTRLDIMEASLANLHLPTGNVTFEAVTPVAVHTTLPDGHTYFYFPSEDEFAVRLQNNLRHKFEAISGKEADTVHISPCGEFKKIVTKYKNYYITGYTGRFNVNTTIRMAEFIYNTGLGEKNSQGLGFVKVLGD